MAIKYDLRELLVDRDEELKLQKKTERHLTQQDIRKLMEKQHKNVSKADIPDSDERSEDE